MAIALADKLGATVNIGRDTLAYLRAAVEQGRSEDDFTLMYRDFEALGEGIPARVGAPPKRGT